MNEATQGYLGDKEMLSDLLATQKHITNGYNTRAGEIQCDNLRGTFLNLLQEEHRIQNQLFCDSHSRGWYPVKEAPVADITAAKQLFLQ
ncbi:MAG: spore coat protein [Oscillospiraceae bacterium]|nr:spore coat protein [Oscillospiraceae bacterium]